MPLGVLGTEEITTIGLQFFAWFLKVTEESRKKKLCIQKNWYLIYFA